MLQGIALVACPSVTVCLHTPEVFDASCDSLSVFDMLPASSDITAIYMV